jgi:signal transduction histidine kinase
LVIDLIPEIGPRRPAYFAFQGLFMAVVLLLVFFQTQARVEHLWMMTALLSISLVVLRLVPEKFLSEWWFHAIFFIGDALTATITLQWMRPRADLFLVYLFLVFGSALTRSTWQRLLVAGVAIALYFISGLRSAYGGIGQPEFWLRAIFLIVSSILMILLSRDARNAQQEQMDRYEERLVQVGRLATLERVAGEVAHRIKGPLTTISVDAEVLSHRLKSDLAAQKELTEIRDEVERCKTILKDLLDLGRIEEMDVVALDLCQPIRLAIKSLASQAKQKQITLKSVMLPKAMPARGDMTLIQEAISAILQNAIEAVGQDGTVEVTATTLSRVHRISITDDGIGISTRDVERVFEPFFTTKKRDGSGLGLSAALRIAAKHGGTIEAESAGVGRGARFTLVIPAI